VASWAEVESEAAELAALARRYLDARTHKTLATLRRDGSPRISGTEATFLDGELWLGSMWRSRKARDLQRDPRFALHSGSEDPPEWDGDAKLSGRLVEVSDRAAKQAVLRARGSDEPPGNWHLFRAELSEVVVTHLNEARDRLVIEFWREGSGVRRIERD
jgi:hypothetical protein